MATHERSASFVFPLLFCLAGLACAITLSFLFGWNPLFAVAVFGSLIFLLLFFYNPLVALCALLIVRMSLDYSTNYWVITWQDWSITLSQLFGVGVAAFGLFLFLLFSRKMLSFPLTFPFALLIGWGSLTLLYTVSPEETIKEVLRVIGLFTIAFFAYIAATDRKKYAWLLGGIFLSALLPILTGLYQYVFNIGYTDVAFSAPRIFGTFAHPNVFSLYLCAVLAAIVLSLTLEKSNRLVSQKHIFFFGGAILLLLFLTFTRIGWLVAFVFITAVTAYKFRFALIPLITFPLLLFVFSSPFQDRVLESFERDPDSSIVWRQNLWHDVTLKTIQEDRVWLGSGMNTFPLIAESLRGDQFGSNDSHNDFVKFFVEGGFVGLFVYCLYLLSLLVILGKAYIKTKERWLKHSIVIFTLFFFAITLASLSDNLFKNTPVGWIFFALFGALLSLVSQKDK